MLKHRISTKYNKVNLLIQFTCNEFDNYQPEKIKVFIYIHGLTICYSICTA